MKKLIVLFLTSLLLVACGTPSAERDKAVATPTATVIPDVETVNKSVMILNEECYLRDITNDNAKKLVIKGNVSLQPERAKIFEDAEAITRPDFSSNLIGMPNLETMEVEEGISESPNTLGKLYVKDNMLLYRYPQNGVYACPMKLSGKVNIPDGVTDVYHNAFFQCENIESIRIPKTVKWLGNAVFGYNCRLKKMEVDKENKYIKSEDNVLYTKDGKVLLAYPAGKPDKNFKVPKGVVFIAPGAFAGATNLKTIEIPKGVYYVGEFAFKGCNNLEKFNCESKIAYACPSAYVDCDKITWKQWIPQKYEDETVVIDMWEALYKDLRYLKEAYPWEYDIVDQFSEKTIRKLQG